MILMQGSTRLLDAPIIETSTSPTTRVASIYGITSYNQLINKVITIVSGANGTNAATTLNINNLGAKNIKRFSNGPLVDPETNWIMSNMVYQVVYNGNAFILLNGNSGGSQVTVPIYNIPADVDALTNSSTQAEITTAFGGASELTNFLNALEDNYTLQFSNESAVNVFVVCEYSSTTTSVVLSYFRPDNLMKVKLEFTRSGYNLTALVRTEEKLSEIVEIPAAVNDLTVNSTSQEIVAAFGGEDNLLKIVNCIKNGEIVYHTDGSGEYKFPISGRSYYAGSSNWSLSYYYNYNYNHIYELCLDYTDSTYSWDKYTYDLYLDYDINKLIYKYEDNNDASLNDILTQLKTWKYGDGSQYPPATPTETQLTTFMNATIGGTTRKNRIESLMTEGTILKFNNILSGADRKSIYNKYLSINKSYSAMTPNDYQYDFVNIGTYNTEFYLYWSNSDSKWYWNTQGGGGGEACFAEGTKVYLGETDCENIENLSEGDIVLTMGEDGSFNYQPIENIVSHDETHIFRIVTSSGELVVTKDHEFKTDCGPIRADKLDIEMNLIDLYGRPVYIKEIITEVLDKPIKVYDIATENGNYFVGDCRVQVYTEEVTKKEV